MVRKKKVLPSFLCATFFYIALLLSKSRSFSHRQLFALVSSSAVLKRFIVWQVKTDSLRGNELSLLSRGNILEIILIMRKTSTSLLEKKKTVYLQYFSRKTRLKSADGSLGDFRTVARRCAVHYWCVFSSPQRFGLREQLHSGGTPVSACLQMVSKSKCILYDVTLIWI